MKKTILVALGAAFFIIGVNETFHHGILASYWLFMLSGACFLGIQFSKKATDKSEETPSKSSTSKKSSNRKRKKK
ncbi:hypothetical protein KMW28_16265 [Flammeovirga yaeyamensis]|uniref:Uncharacterized protein n=1 Tax=Flammeovirga yaeyamensis TaxID=367791 RepID=A0AAX1N140_9BACT|nr:MULTISPECIES: hypothetical protein [Flammeovirga]ANQ47389.1 hypothetical protein MY04_0004 [Flammeovirga sp. MY04]MBB3698434.1 thiol:disulfide interchange protein [Flammeovirga yaeyamensis]NMF34216.1 hypothetical protein [Flammeovirga yaeyamensis]QWG01201.1 hypothetical protein KMW28_16265 [Flammeovirga yaeyamensis]